MPIFVPGTRIESEEPNILVEMDPANPLPSGRHRFELVVFDQEGNASEPDVVEIIVRDSLRPTAVIDAPLQVEAGQPFEMSGRRSSDVPPGRVVRWVWQLLG